MVSHLGRAVLLALVVIVLGSSLATIPGASAGSPNYAITGYVYPVGSSRDYANVQVDLVSQATGAVFTTLTNSGGQFSFTYGSTSGALQPGYWGLWIPVQTNITTLTSSIGRCAVCAVLPSNQTPAFSFYTASALTTNPPTPILYATILSYTVKVSGTVELSGTALPDAPVQLLAALYNGAVLYNTTSNSTTGAYTLKAPPGSWVVQATDPNPPGYVGTTNVTAVAGTVTANPNIQSYVVSGQMLKAKNVPVGTTGNATLFDPSTGYIYSTPTDVSGRYTLGTYGANFGSGTNTFDLFLSSEGFGTIEQTFTTRGATTPVTINAILPRVTSAQRGLYSTTLDFSKFSNATGTGNLTVNTTAVLGNNSIVQNLPNATVGQLWSQLGLDFNHSTDIPATLLSAFYSWVNTTGPFFPAVQAGTSINGTGFVPPTTSQPLTSWATGCTGTCGPGTSSSLTLSWSNSYALNGSVYRNSSTYSMGFGFRHPSSSSDIYNYTVVLPTGYVLKAGTSAPTNTRLLPLGPDDTWSKFTLQSLYSASPAGTLNFTIISATTIVAIVNATIPTYFAFSNQNVLNSTIGNYTVEVGKGQNVTFSALNTIYPSGINGTKFLWNFGDGSYSNVTTTSTYHIYAKGTTGNSPDTGSLTVIGSNHYNDTTAFHVWVATGPTTAGIVSNASASQNRTVSGTPYLFINWGTVLRFNATGSKASVSPGTTAVQGVLSVASFSLVSKGFSQSANYSESAGAYFGSNWTYQFLGAGSYLTNGTVSGNLIPFKGWQYNLTLRVWSGTGQTATTTLVILVNDTEKPIAGFQILNSAGSVVSSKTPVVALSNLSAQIQLNGANSTDPHNGSVVRYYWLIGQVGNGSLHLGTNVTTVKPYPKFWLAASTSNYWVNLTVFDRNNNAGYTNQTLTVAANTTTTPILAATNLTGPAKLTESSSSTFWVNITVGGGTKSTALDIRVAWYTTSPGGTSRRSIGSTVTFYNYTSSGVVNTVPMGTGTVPSYPYSNTTWKATLRAVITWSPPITGNYVLYANATASNEFVGDYSSATNVASMSISISPNATTQTLEYVAIGVAAVVVILLIVLYVRRRGGRGKAPKSTSKSGLERGSKRSTDEDEEDES